MGETDAVGDAARGIEKLDFHHPYTPYDVQEQFMRTVYDVLEAGDGQVGILESPTGTVSWSGLSRGRGPESGHRAKRWRSAMSPGDGLLTGEAGQVSVPHLRVADVAAEPQVPPARGGAAGGGRGVQGRAAVAGGAAPAA